MIANAWLNLNDTHIIGYVATQGFGRNGWRQSSRFGSRGDLPTTMCFSLSFPSDPFRLPCANACTEIHSNCYRSFFFYRSYRSFGVIAAPFVGSCECESDWEYLPWHVHGSLFSTTPREKGSWILNCDSINYWHGWKRKNILHNLYIHISDKW
jgi:hypothetical protein